VSKIFEAPNGFLEIHLGHDVVALEHLARAAPPRYHPKDEVLAFLEGL